MMEDIKLLVQEEGRSARNLVAFNVPVIQTQCDSGLGKLMRKPPTSPRSQLDFKKDESRCSKRSRDSSQSGSRVRSASTGRDKKSELHARYWAFLFGNLQRAVDEIYQTCESDESVTECKEVIMVLDNYTREFRNLINWFKIKWEYETTPPPQRPRSLAWEIRKSSPGKIRHKSMEPVLNDNLKNQTPLSPAVCSIYDNRPQLNLIKYMEPSTETNESKGTEVNTGNGACISVVNVAVKDEVAVPSSNVKPQTNFDVSSQPDSESHIINSTMKDSENPNLIESKKCNDLHVENFILPDDMKLKNYENNENIHNSVVDHVMVDEICQTDPEKDVDENGPKYRSSGQQTSSVLTGFDEAVEKNKDNLNAALGSNSDHANKFSSGNTTLRSSTKTKSLEDSPPVRTLSTSASSKTGSSLDQNLNMVTQKPLSSYSNATNNQTRISSGQTSNRTGSAVRVPRIYTNSKVSSTSMQRYPWGTRPSAAVAGKASATTPSSPLAGKSPRSRTIAGVQGSKTVPPKVVKTFSVTKQSQALTTKNIGPFSTQIVRPKTPTISPNKISHKSTKIPKDNEDVKIKTTDTSKESFPAEVGKLNNSNSNTSLSSGSSSVKHQEVCGSVEVLTSQENGNEEDGGWVKVRSRSRFSLATKTGDLETTLSRSASNLKPKVEQKGPLGKMIHKIRFHQPTSAISLPTLAFFTNDCKENITLKKTLKTKTDVKNKSKENLKTVKKSEKNKIEEMTKKKNSVEKAKKNCNRLLNEKDLNVTANNTGHAKTESVENEKNKYLGEKTAEEIVKGSGSTPYQDSIDDEENHFDEEIKKNKEKEEMLQKEINDLEAADIEMDIETGDEETDGETTTGTEEEPDQEKRSNTSVIEEVEKKPSPKKQLRYEGILSGLSWADHMDTLDELEKLVAQDCSNKGMTKDEQMDTLERLEEFVARHPGRALELHQKLSSPSRRRTMLDTVKRFQARQAKASEKREQLKMARAQKLRELLKKVDEVKAAKDKLIQDRRQRLEMKLKRAAENRNLHLKEIMRKAHDEEEKLKEIAFINELEAQNKRHDFMTQCQEQEGRLQGIHEERQRKQEEKAAKEAAFEERRKAIEAERQEKLEKLQERQRKRDEQADKKKQEKEKERQELAREKARDRSERLEALHAAQLEAQEELQKKIQQKQEDYARRHEENIEQIRQKALELSILKCSDDVAPKLAPYETQKLCTACNVLIGSEVYLLSHLRGKKHQEAVKNQINGKDLAKEEVGRYNIKIIVNAPSDKIDPKIALDKERLKSFKKKCKKIRLRMILKGDEYESKLESSEKLDSPGKGKLQKCLKDVEKAIKSQGKGQWNDSAITLLERSMGEISRTLYKQNSQDQAVFLSLNGFDTLNSILQLDMEVPPNMMPYLPQKCFVTASSTYLAAINNSPSNCKYVILSNKIISLLDLLLKRLTVLIPDNAASSVGYHSKSSLPVDSFASTLLRVIAKILLCAEETDLMHSDEYLKRLQDIISYTVSAGIVDKLSKYCKSVRDPIDDDQSAAQFLLNILELLTTLTLRCKTVRQGDEDPTQLLATLQVTELVGAVSILYGMLLHQGAPPRLIDATPPPLLSRTVAVAVGTIRLLRSVAELDLQMFQSILGAEGISLQFRHIASYLLWYCCHDREKILLHEVVAVVGYFAVQHRDNQMILQSGSTPTVLQQLCSLPFPYFSNPELSALLFPTLLACCSDNEENKAILEQEISYSLLEDFTESETARNHPLIRILSTRSKGGKSQE